MTAIFTKRSKHPLARLSISPRIAPRPISTSTGVSISAHVRARPPSVFIAQAAAFDQAPYRAERTRPRPATLANRLLTEGGVGMRKTIISALAFLAGCFPLMRDHHR